MSDLILLFPEVRTVLKNAIPSYWPEMKSILHSSLEEPMMAEAILPLASCQAVSGDPRNAIHITAAGIAIGISLRILDDLVDQDRTNELWNQVGEARAWNYASAIFALSFEILRKASLPVGLHNTLNGMFLDSFMNISAGQDRDISNRTNSMDDYWLTVKMKTATAFQLACKAGAIVGTENTQLIQACSDFGSHLGFTIQAFNDMESIWQYKGLTDLKQGKFTLPLLYGLQFVHPEQEELLSIVNTKMIASKAERIKEILDNIDTKGYLIWVALKERELALEAISICPNNAGKEVLESYITGMFGDINILLEKEIVNQTPSMKS